MAKFTYNNTKNTSISYIFFKLNCSFHLKVLYNKDLNLCSKSKTPDKLVAKLRKLMTVSKKTTNILQNFKSVTIINMQNLEAIFQIIKFG